MHMVTTTHRWARADLGRLPDDGNRYEVLDGELFVTPQAAYRHQAIAFDLAFALQRYCIDHDIGRVVGPGAVVFDQNELQPDVQVIPGHHPPQADTEWEQLPLPLLVAEVLSDSTRQRDFGKKKAAYERLGIATYWIVDPGKRRVIAMSVRSAEPEIVTDVLRWQPRGDLPPLEIPIATFLGAAPAPG
jgi:Uma2 family endonuclease